MKRIAWVLVLLMIGWVPVFGESAGELLLNAGFDDADLAGWRIAGDVCVAPAFCAGEPSGRYWVALSTNDSQGYSHDVWGIVAAGDSISDAFAEFSSFI